jgi:uncharacterized protein (TIGR00251 family)
MENAKDLLLAQGRLALKVTPRARSEGIEGLNTAGELVVKVRAAPEDGRANDAVIAMLAEAFSLPKSALAIVRGSTGRHKIVAYRRGKA